MLYWTVDYKAKNDTFRDLKHYRAYQNKYTMTKRRCISASSIGIHIEKHGSFLKNSNVGAPFNLSLEKAINILNSKFYTNR